MGVTLNRRQWLKSSAIAGTALAFFPNYPACSKKDIIPHDSEKDQGLLRLNNNESPYGLSKDAREAIIESIEHSNRYPHNSYPELIELIAERENVSPENVILGAGSTELMTGLIHLFRARGTVLAADPTYFDFMYYAELVDCPIRQIPLTDNFEHDLENMKQSVTPETSFVYICNPSNPTGMITPKGKLRAFCEEISQKVLIVVDEAYHEYVEDNAYASMVDLVRGGKNIIVTRTFSKIFGFAGLRVGYGIAGPGTVKEFEGIERNFAPISYPSLGAAVASFKDPGFCTHVKQKNSEVRSYLYGELKKLDLFYVPSQTNFVLFRIEKSGEEMLEEFKKRRILLRSAQFKSDNWLRVSLGTMDEMKTFVSVLSDLI